MHKYAASASPYFCEITIDPSLVYIESDLNIFKAKNERGVAVYGHLPNVLVVANEPYGHWVTVGLLVSGLDTGKLALCGSNFPSDFLQHLECLNPSVKIRLLSLFDIEKGREWLQC